MAKKAVQILARKFTKYMGCNLNWEAFMSQSEKLRNLMQHWEKFFLISEAASPKLSTDSTIN